MVTATLTLRISKIRVILSQATTEVHNCRISHYVQTSSFDLYKGIELADAENGDSSDESIQYDDELDGLESIDNVFLDGVGGQLGLATDGVDEATVR